MRKVSIFVLTLLLICSLVNNVLANEEVSSEIDYVNDNDVESIYELINEYYNEGEYIKDTTINFTLDAVEDFEKYFHLTPILSRTTRYKDDSIWMSRGEESNDSIYSYYGTIEGKIYSGETTKAYNIPDKIGYTLPEYQSVEDYYTTLYDIKTYETDWEYLDGVYTTYDINVLKMFFDFTAPCLYADIFNSNVFEYKKATIKIVDGNLVLSLWVSATDYGFVVGGKDMIVDDGVILSEATIYSNKIKGTVIDRYLGISNSDSVTYNDLIYLYGGNTGELGRVDKIFCYDTTNELLYELDAKMPYKSTSHRAIRYGSKVYIFNGVTPTRLDSIVMHDLERGTIEVLDAKIPEEINCAQIGYYNDKVYIVGGLTSIAGGKSSVSNRIYEFDLKTYESKLLDVSLPVNIYKGSWCSVDNYLYIIGGTASARYQTIYRIDMESHEIKLMNGMIPVQLSQCRAMYDGYGNIYFYGGTLEGNKFSDAIYKYSIINDEVSLFETKLPLALANVSLGKVDDIIYIFGGSDNTPNVIIKHDKTDVYMVEIKSNSAINESNQLE